MDFARRRERLAARLPDLGIDALLVTCLPNVRYLTGFTGSNGQVVVSVERSVFLTDGRYTEQARREVSDLQRVTYPVALPPAFAESGRALGARRVGFESSCVSYRLYQDLGTADGMTLVPTEGEVGRLRWAKDPEEIERIRQSQELTDDAFERVLSKVVEGMTERDVAFELELSMREGGAEGLAFDSIVAFGEHAAEPHHHPTDRDLRPGDIVKLDFGALSGGYHSDMTRTVAFGQPPPELREIHDVVRAAQRAGMQEIAPGVIGAVADLAARRGIEDAGYGPQFSHSLGHGVGLEIHEGPMLRSTSEDVVPATTVVTVEPGIYLPGLGGVRVEDIVEVTDEGCRPMPRSTGELIVL